MKAKKYKVIKEYKSPYPSPIFFKKAESVKIKKEFKDDPDWRNWVWVEGENNNKAWTPKQYLKINNNMGVFTKDYNALELSICMGEELSIYETINGFGMAEKQNGEKGWVPLKNLEFRD